MVRSIFKASIENAFYFSFATFIIATLAGFLYNLLEKSPGRLNLGVVIMVVLCLILVMFLLALVNIVLREESRAGFWMRLLAIFLFIILASLILGLLAFLFLWQF
ncbi:hypothetical protein JW711_02155 [Candidatus Woesearchaeota archaeon]|nr:hypothetical protein [Candidatus Woesearchaeota archaeon]